MTDTTATTAPGTAASALTVAVIGAGGKMGMRVSNNLQKSEYNALYSEASPAGQERTREAGREITATPDAVKDADVVILAVPDVVLGAVSEDVIPQMKSGAIILTLDPAAAYAGLLAKREDIHYAVAHPCHPSVFLERTTPEEWADTFGGIAAPQEVVAALEDADDDVRAIAEKVISTIYAPVIAVHWVTVKQLAVLEPTLVETIACMVGEFLKEALDETVNGVGVPYEAARAMLYGHTWIALTNGLRGSNPFSEACHIAMGYGREALIKDDWKKIFDDSELDSVIAKMLKIDAVKR
ncbi:MULTISPECIES: phosphogluconate dehydrogenase C-terminal domain-containing protein [Rathayibacter]|uniref:phosphogluconate dehydrogenase C-terminal domain-containing protein n=1 Tax=Rathayibacter TaxID=33886 RepID=UPI000F4B1222|nr:MULTISPECIES: phosphogluconate dehydrogenase C-terminal domain-containing protein [Rathayibacter]MCJ1674136.1 NAD(P)-binding domain-containing protein [Rathayibacter sp. VKM Ac-2929]MCJ1684417.1 NAD(P)-binding domain-containing protein [Rathayibacter sp. VKM Ac-2928]MCJ1689455.1 NAD(P)-binding domain-containing protein [Rathayibacter sp. VKM Ac-2927]MCJ1700766.1 NAD(P)-binding domain-containing protein [Rathayibacter festucae]ROQ58595.1 acetohydroxy acid isomeroreductase-like protein [Ratha